MGAAGYTDTQRPKTSNDRRLPAGLLILAAGVAAKTLAAAWCLVFLVVLIPTRWAARAGGAEDGAAAATAAVTAAAVASVTILAMLLAARIG